MEIYYVDGDGSFKGLNDEDPNAKLTPDLLKSKLSRMDIMADLDIISPYRATVRVHKHIGTTMFLAEGADNHIWLQSKAIKKEDKGAVTVYHFVFD